MMRLTYLLRAGAARAAIDADEITALPGWDGALPTRMPATTAPPRSP